MTEQEEMYAIAGSMLIKIFPEESIKVIRLLRIICNQLDDKLSQIHIIMEKDEIMEVIKDSLGFMAIHANIESYE